MSKVMMSCGCVAQGTKMPENIPVCVVHGCTDQMETPTLDGRIAQCLYCRSEQPSNVGLAFFEYRLHMPTDGYYCGCYGWD